MLPHVLSIMHRKKFEGNQFLFNKICSCCIVYMTSNGVKCYIGVRFVVGQKILCRYCEVLGQNDLIHFIGAHCFLAYHLIRLYHDWFHDVIQNCSVTFFCAGLRASNNQSCGSGSGHTVGSGFGHTDG